MIENGYFWVSIKQKMNKAMPHRMDRVGKDQPCELIQ